MIIRNDVITTRLYMYHVIFVKKVNLLVILTTQVMFSSNAVSIIPVLVQDSLFHFFVSLFKKSLSFCLSLLSDCP